MFNPNHFFFLQKYSDVLYERAYAPMEELADCSTHEEWKKNTFKKSISSTTESQTYSYYYYYDSITV
jgi:hypothetical protein